MAGLNHQVRTERLRADHRRVLPPFTPTQQTLPADWVTGPQCGLLILQKRFYLLVQFLERHGAFESLAIDEEGRRRIDLQDLVGEFLIGGELVEQRLIRCAGFDRLFAQPGLFADQLQGIDAMCGPRLFRLIGLGLIDFGLIGLGLIGLGLIGVLRPRRFLGARGHPGIVLGRARPRRYTGRLAAHPVRQVRQMLARGLPGARRQRNAGKAEQCPFACRGGMIHLWGIAPECGDQGA